MTYRIELEKINKTGFTCYDLKNEFVYGAEEVKTFIEDINLIAEGYKIIRIIKTTKDGRGNDVTDKYIK